ncbi:MAG: hypothetical protein FWE24_05200 [Defluviitaleaceae bacterium]|nr:hypothetical protein [Defluviitaleaceae bacterium]
MPGLLSRLKKNNKEADIDNGQNNVDDIDNIDDDLNLELGRNKNKLHNEPKKRRWIGVVVLIAVLVAVAGFGFAVFQYNAFGLRDNHLRNILETVPIVNNLLPPLEMEDPVYTMSADELLLEIARLETYNYNLSTEITRLEGLNRTYLAQISSLQEFEAAHLEVMELREVLDREIAFGDPINFERFFADVSPANAEEIFREIVGINQNDREFRALVSTFVNMDESSAAEILEQLLRSEPELVVNILSQMGSQQRADILATMNLRSAEQIVRRMAPTAP